MKKINLKVLATALATLTISGCTAEQQANFKEGFYGSEYTANSVPQQVIIVQQPDNTEDLDRSILEHNAAISSAVSRSLSNDTSAAIIGRSLY